MAHAEKCPVCKGKGTVIDPDSYGKTAYLPKRCHGCEGKGWVEVGNEQVIGMAPSIELDDLDKKAIFETEESDTST